MRIRSGTISWNMAPRALDWGRTAFQPLEGAWAATVSKMSFV